MPAARKTLRRTASHRSPCCCHDPRTTKKSSELTPSVIPSVLTLIGEAWSFIRRQPVLLPVLLWLIVLPSTLINVLALLSGDIPFFPDSMNVTVLVLLAEFMLAIVMLWGTASAVIVGKRLVQAKAGRSRSSFSVVRHQGAHFILPLVFTGVLRGCITILLALLLVIPGVIYAVRTSFYTFTVVLEDLSFRDALRRSSAIVRGKTWSILWALFALTVVLYLPPNIVLWFVREPILDMGIAPALLLELTDAAVNGVLSLIFMFALMLLYKECMRKSNA